MTENTKPLPATPGSLAGSMPEAASFSANGSGVVGNGSDLGGPFIEFNPDMPELRVHCKDLGIEERAAVRVAMAQAAEELTRLRGAGLSRDQQGSASSEGLADQVRPRRNWVLSGGQMRTDFHGSRSKGWNRFAG